MNGSIITIIGLGNKFMIKRKMLDNEGSLTIIFVILILVSTVIVTGFLNIVMRTVTSNEIQGIMDESGIVALRQSVDNKSLRLEEIVIDENKAKQNYIKLINENMSSGNGKLIKKYNIDMVNVYPPNHPNLKKIGIPNGERNQYFIESIINVEYMKSSVGTGFVKAGIDYFDYLSGNRVKKFEHNADNQKALVLRSVSRLVLR